MIERIIIFLSLVLLGLGIYYTVDDGWMEKYLSKDEKKKGEVVGKVVKLERHVRFHDETSIVWQFAEKDQLVNQGDFFYTGENSSTKLLIGNDHIEMNEKTLLQIDTQGGANKINLAQGTLKLSSNRIFIQIDDKTIEASAKNFVIAKVKDEIKLEAKDAGQIKIDNKIIPVHKDKPVKLDLKNAETMAMESIRVKNIVLNPFHDIGSLLVIDWDYSGELKEFKGIIRSGRLTYKTFTMAAGSRNFPLKLKQEVGYTFRITAINESGEEVESDEVAIKRKPLDKIRINSPGIGQVFEIEEFDEATTAFNWKDNRIAGRYEVMLWDAQDKLETYETSNELLVIKNLIGKYQWQVRGWKGNQLVGVSEKVAFEVKKILRPRIEIITPVESIRIGISGINNKVGVKWRAVHFSPENIVANLYRYEGINPKKVWSKKIKKFENNFQIPMQQLGDYKLVLQQKVEGKLVKKEVNFDIEPIRLRAPKILNPKIKVKR
jgi:hypothetical protein